MLPKFTWDVESVAFRIPFGLFDHPYLELRWYSLLFVGVFLGGYSLLRWQIVRGGGDEEDAGDFIVYGVIAVLGGSRLGHVLFYDTDKFLANPAMVWKIWEGGLASHGAVLGLILAMWLFTRRRGIAFLEGADRFAFSAALGATLVRVGNFFNSEIVGIKTDQSWGVQFPRNLEDARDYASGKIESIPYRHPSQLYEAAIGLSILLALWVADRAWGKERRPRGALISLFFLLYFPARFLVEFVKEHQVFRGPDATLDMGQYLSIPGILLGAYGLWWSFQRRLPAGWRSRFDALPPEDEGSLPAESVDAPPRKKKKKKKKKSTTGAAPGPRAAEGSESPREAPGEEAGRQRPAGDPDVDAESAADRDEPKER